MQNVVQLCIETSFQVFCQKLIEQTEVRSWLAFMIWSLSLFPILRRSKGRLGCQSRMLSVSLPLRRNGNYFFSKLPFYEEGEHTGRLLAKIAHSQQTSPSIGALRTSTGVVTNSPDEIMPALVSYYSDFSLTLQTYTEDSLHTYLGKVELSTLLDSARQQLDAPLTLEELQVATGMFPNAKAPGEDGVPAGV